MLLLNLHFYKTLLMLREDISWTVSVEKDGRLQDCDWRGWLLVVAGSIRVMEEMTSTKQGVTVLFYWRNRDRKFTVAVELD